MDTLGQIISLVVAVLTGIGIVLAWRKIWPEIRSTDSTTLQRYQDMLDRASIREQTLRDAAEVREAEYIEKETLTQTKTEQREKTMLTKIEGLDTRVGDLEKQLQAAVTELGKVKDWAARLSAQVISFGETPVPFEPKPRNPTQPRKDK